MSCYNKIIITGKSVAEFEKTIDNRDFSFSQTIPNPQGNINSIWNFENWGTSKDCSEGFLESSRKNKLIITCFTCGPPSNWVKNVIKKYDDLRISILSRHINCEYAIIIRNKKSYDYTFIIKEIEKNIKLDFGITSIDKDLYTKKYSYYRESVKEDLMDFLSDELKKIKNNKNKQ